MILKKKRGLSPVIATVLLIAVALVLAVIIFLWAKSFVGEQVQKEGQNIELVCENVHFLAEAYNGQLLIENTGSVAIYAVEIRVKGEGEIREIGEPQDGGTVGPGQTANFILPSDIRVGQAVIIVPVLLGETRNEKVPKVCDIDYGVETEVLY